MEQPSTELTRQQKSAATKRKNAEMEKVFASCVLRILAAVSVARG